MSIQQYPKISILYSHKDQLIYRTNVNKELQSLMTKTSMYYTSISKALDVNVIKKATILPPTSQHEYSSWCTDLLLLDLCTRPFYIRNITSGIGKSSSSYHSTSLNDDKACLASVMVVTILSALIAFGAGIYGTKVEGNAAKANAKLLKEIQEIHKQFDQVNVEGQVNLSEITNALHRIENCLRKEAQYHGVNTVFGAIGTVGVGLLLITLIDIALLHFGNISTNMPLDYLAISGGAALALALIAISFNYGLRKKVDQKSYQNAWDTILSRAALPSSNLKQVKALYEKWCQEPGKKYFIISRETKGHSFWTIESDNNNLETDGIIINHYYTTSFVNLLLHLSAEGYEKLRL